MHFIQHLLLNFKLIQKNFSESILFYISNMINKLCTQWA